MVPVLSMQAESERSTASARNIRMDFLAVPPREPHVAKTRPLRPELPGGGPMHETVNKEALPTSGPAQFAWLSVSRCTRTACERGTPRDVPIQARSRLACEETA